MPQHTNHSLAQAGTFQSSSRPYGGANLGQAQYVGQYGATQQPAHSTPAISYEHSLSQVGEQMKPSTEIGNDWFDQLLKECKPER